MRILVVSNLYPPHGGADEVACRQMVDELRRRGHDVQVLTAPAPSPPPDDEAHVRRALHHEDAVDPQLNARLHPVIRRSLLLRAAVVDVGNLRSLRLQMEEFRPEVVYLWHLLGVGGIALALAVHLRRAPWVWHLTDAVPLRLCDAAGGARPQAAALLARRLEGSWIVQSQGLVEEIEAGGAALAGRVELLPPWFAGPRPVPRTSWYEPGNGPLRCLVTGGVGAEAGIDILIDAVAALREQGLGALTLDVYGDGPERGRLEVLVRALHLDGAVRFHGHPAQPAQGRLLAESDVLIRPSRGRDPLGIPPVEAAAAGCVPVVTAAGGHAEWFVDRVHALVVPRTADGFAAALRSVLTGDVALASIARRAEAIARDEFHVSRLAPTVEGILQRAAGGVSGARVPVPWDRLERSARIAERLCLGIISDA